MSIKSSRSILVGVDGGQTSMRCVICDGHGVCLSHVETSSRSRMLDVANRHEAETKLLECIGFALDEAQVRTSDVTAVAVGMTGVPEPESESGKRWATAVKRQFPDAIVHINSDIAAALYGAAGFGPGVVVISGTGSIALGRDGKGRTARAGGWGYVLGDEGSGFAIGLSALKAITLAEDDMGEKTSLTQLIMEELGLEKVYDIKRYLYARRIVPSAIAALSRQVALAAGQGDEVAKRILLDAGRDLAALVVSVLSQLDRLNHVTTVYPVGGVLANDELVAASLRSELARLAPKAVVAQSRLPAVAGAVIMAKTAAEEPVDDSFIDMLEKSLHKEKMSKRVRQPVTWDLESLRAHLKGRLIVSSQATPPDFSDDPYVLTCLAKAALSGGAVAVRANGPDVIREMREAFAAPILGINKIGRETNEVYITPTLAAAREVIEAGADFIAVDATNRPRPDGGSAAELIAQIKANYDIPIVADISTTEEAVEAERCGADFVATTLAGYTRYTKTTKLRGASLVQDIATKVDIPILAEGNIWRPEEAVAAINAGAWAVVIGSAITRPRLIAARFAKALADSTQEMNLCTDEERTDGDDANGL